VIELEYSNSASKAQTSHSAQKLLLLVNGQHATTPDFDANLPTVDYRRKEQISNDIRANNHQYLEEPKIVGMSPYLTLFNGKKLRFSLTIHLSNNCPYVA
jgi:hypothetical protein